MNRKFSWTASVTALYVILILAVHPIIYQDYYFNILNVKYLFYCACTIGMLILLGGYFIFTGAFKQIKLKLIPTDYAFLAFIVIATLSAAFSDFKYEEMCIRDSNQTAQPEIRHRFFLIIRIHGHRKLFESLFISFIDCLFLCNVCLLYTSI